MGPMAARVCDERSIPLATQDPFTTTTRDHMLFTMADQQRCPYCQGPTKPMSVLTQIARCEYQVCEHCGGVAERSGDGSLVALTLVHASLTPRDDVSKAFG